MGTKVVIKHLGGSEIGIITQNPVGQLIVQTHIPALQAELENMVRKVSQQSLSYLFNATETIGSKTVQKTVQKFVKPGDAEYLPALADELSKSQIHIAGKRVRGYIDKD